MKKQNLKFAFFGTSNFAVTVLMGLLEAGYVPSLIVTSPDKPAGRGSNITPPPIKKFAFSNSSLGKVKIIQPNRLSDLDVHEREALDSHFDLFIVVDYGKIIPQIILDLPQKGSLNVHVSLLPNYRGASPMQTAILEGRDETGVTIMEVVAGLDEGRIVASEKIDLANWKPTFMELATKSAQIGAQLLIQSIPKWIDGSAKPTIQDSSKATYTRRFVTNDGYIASEIITDPPDEKSVLVAERKIRALNPNPGTWTILNTDRGEIRIKILSAKIENGKLLPIKIVPAGKREMTWSDFLRGYKII